MDELDDTSEMKKLIDSLLDTLLVIGAIACVLTIGGGRWLTQGMNPYDTTRTVPVTGGTDPVGVNRQYVPMPGMVVPGAAAPGMAAPEMAAPMISAPENVIDAGADGESPCPPYPTARSADWSEAHLLRSRYFEYMRDNDLFGGDDSFGIRALDCR